MKTTYEEVEQIYLTMRSHVRNTNSIVIFENNYHNNIINLVNKVNSNYQYSKYHIFMIHDPKCRIIMSECLEDKIVNHLVSYKILSKLDKYMIDSNCATRKNKGTKYARKLLDKYLAKVKNSSNTFYILKFDIHKYFYSIDHTILLYKLKKYLSNEELFEIKKILDTTNQDYILNGNYGYSYKKGLPIGNMTSQILAIYYLNDLDHFIKEELACKYYIRYMDDGIIISDNKNKLRDVKDILENRLKDEYKLKLNSKTKIYKSTEGFTFLGIRYRIRNNKIIRNIPSIKKNKIRKRLSNKNYNSYLPIFKYIKEYLNNSTSKTK